MSRWRDESLRRRGYCHSTEVNEWNRDVSPLADQQCVSAHFSCGPLTFNINGETIISSSAGAALPRNVEVVLASLRIYSS
jgi:hypothetical protein